VCIDLDLPPLQAVAGVVGQNGLRGVRRESQLAGSAVCSRVRARTPWNPVARNGRRAGVGDGCMSQRVRADVQSWTFGLTMSHMQRKTGFGSRGHLHA
jgi:hypothetical protein